MAKATRFWRDLNYTDCKCFRDKNENNDMALVSMSTVRNNGNFSHIKQYISNVLTKHIQKDNLQTSRNIYEIGSAGIDPSLRINICANPVFYWPSCAKQSGVK